MRKSPEELVIHSRALSDPAKNHSKMAENSNISFRENDKLKGSSNYYVWALKMRAVLRGEGQWTITETE